MKKFMYVILFMVIVVLGIGVNIKTDVKAIMTPNFDFEVNSPRFQYLMDDNNILITYDFTLLEYFDSIDDVSNIVVTLNQVTYDGSYVKRLETFETDFKAVGGSSIDYLTETRTAVGDYTQTEYLMFDDINIIGVTGVTVEGVSLTTSDYAYSEELDAVVIANSWSTTGNEIIVSYTSVGGSNYYADLVYDWSDIQWEDNNIIFYQLKLSNFVIFTGSVMLPPQNSSLTYGTFGIEIGEFLVEDSGEPDFSDQSDFTSYLIKDEYIIMHYRIPIGYSNQFDYRVIKITDINSNTIEDVFTTTQIAILQGGTTEDFVNSYIIIPLTENIPEGLVTWFPQINDYYDMFLHNFNVGSFIFAIEDQTSGNSLLSASSVVINIMEDLKNPFELVALKENISAGDKQRILFYKHNELISTSYSTIYNIDSRTGYSFTSYLNIKDETYSGSIIIPEDAIEDSCSSVYWYLDPIFLPYSLDVTDYTIELEESYCIINQNDFGGKLDNFLIDYAMEDELGSSLFSIIVLIIVNILMLFITKSTFIFSTVNIVVMGGLIALVNIPIWVSIILVLIALLGIKLVVTGGGNSYE